MHHLHLCKLAKATFTLKRMKLYEPYIDYTIKPCACVVNSFDHLLFLPMTTKQKLSTIKSYYFFFLTFDQNI